MVYNNNIDMIITLMEHIKIDNKINNNDIANRTNKSKQTISNFFNGRQPNPSLDTLVTICDALGCDLIIDIVPRKGDNA